jgi:host factor-I protein
MSEFQTGLPSVRQVQGFIKDKQDVELKLTTNDVLSGKISWQDQDCICLKVSGQQVLVWRGAIAYMKLRD